MATVGMEEGQVVAWPRCCYRQPCPRPPTGRGHVPNPAARDAIQHSIRPLPVSSLSSFIYPFQIPFFFITHESDMPSIHVVLEFRFGPDALMARRLNCLPTNLLQEKTPSLCHFSPSWRKKVVVAVFYLRFQTAASSR
jgi:hypothetical protein